MAIWQVIKVYLLCQNNNTIYCGTEQEQQQIFLYGVNSGLNLIKYFFEIFKEIKKTEHTVQYSELDIVTCLLLYTGRFMNREEFTNLWNLLLWNQQTD